MENISARIEIANLFEKDENEAFYFSEIKRSIISGSKGQDKTNITFCYSYSNERYMESSLLIDGLVPDNLEHALFCIGMCVLPFYWMGFGCAQIVIEKEVYSGTADILPFWQKLYSNVLLEYLYQNTGADAPVLVLAAETDDAKSSPQPSHFSSDESRGHTLVPIGCEI